MRFRIFGVVFLFAVGAFLSGCAAATSVVPTSPTHEVGASVDLNRVPVGAWPFGAELAELLLRSGPTARFDTGRLVAAGRGSSRDLQFAVDTAEHQAGVAMVTAVGGVEGELVLSPRTEWRGIKQEGGKFVVTVLVTAEVSGGNLK